MSKVNIKIITIGNLPSGLDLSVLNKWSSSIFNISDPIESHGLRADSDLDGWAYSDNNISSLLPTKGSEDILVALVSVPLEENYYSRRVGDNTVIFSYHDTSAILSAKNIPLINVVYRLLYAYSLIFKRNNKHIPEMPELTTFTHDETRGCIYDMNGLKEDLYHSCVKPIICDECSERIIRDKVSQTVVKTVNKELTKVDKELFYKITDWIKTHPIKAIIISSLWAVILGVIASSITK